MLCLIPNLTMQKRARGRARLHGSHVEAKPTYVSCYLLPQSAMISKVLIYFIFCSDIEISTLQEFTTGGQLV